MQNGPHDRSASLAQHRPESLLKRVSAGSQSEQRALLGYAYPPGEPIRARTLLDQDLVGGGVDQSIATDEPELRQGVRIPAFRLPTWRLGHDQTAANVEKGRTALGGGCR
jgi:hypothetical protein